MQVSSDYNTWSEFRNYGLKLLKDTWRQGSTVMFKFAVELNKEVLFFANDKYYQKLNIKRHQPYQPFVLIEDEKLKLKNGASKILC